MTTPMGEPLSRNAEVMGRHLLRRVLASTKELRAGTGLSAKQAKDGIKGLSARGFLDSAELGCRLPAVPRRWLRENGLDYFRASDEERSWHSEAGVGGLLLYELTNVEAVHSIASKLSTEDWLLSAIHWYRKKSIVAAAQYSHYSGAVAYKLFARASAMDTQAQLYYRLAEIPRSAQAECVAPGIDFIPSGLCIVADSEWCAAQALTMAQDILPNWLNVLDISAWYYGRRGWHVSNGESVRTGRPPRALNVDFYPTEWLRPVMNTRGLRRNERLDGVLERCPWTGRAAHGLLPVLRVMGDFPVGSRAHYKSFLGEAKDGKETERRMETLEDLGLSEIVTHKARATARRLPKGAPLTIARRGQGADRHALTKKGRVLYGNCFHGKQIDLASRTNMGKLRTKAGDAVEDQWPYRHEDGVYELLCQFHEKGCPVAPGWQAVITLRNEKAIYPDGIVLVRTPWGLYWCLIEFELSDMSYGALKPRYDAYASEYRMDDRPVLWVCQNERAERNLHRAANGCARPLRMLTTTVGRVKAAGDAGVGVWSRYGEPVTLAAQEPANG